MVMLAVVVLGDVGQRRGESQRWVIVIDMVETGCQATRRCCRDCVKAGGFAKRWAWSSVDSKIGSDGSDSEWCMEFENALRERQ